MHWIWLNMYARIHVYSANAWRLESQNLIWHHVTHCGHWKHMTCVSMYNIWLKYEIFDNGRSYKWLYCLIFLALVNQDLIFHRQKLYCIICLHWKDDTSLCIMYFYNVNIYVYNSRNCVSAIWFIAFFMIITAWDNAIIMHE